MVNEEAIACVECGGETELIKIVDATQPGMVLGATDEKSAASHHNQLQYTAEDSTRSACPDPNVRSAAAALIGSHGGSAGIACRR